MPFSTSRYIKFRRGMQKRISSLRSKTEDSLETAVDIMMEERVDGFFRVEQGLEEVIKSLVEIEEELEAIWSGRKTAQQAMDDAVRRGDEVLRRYESQYKK